MKELKNKEALKNPQYKQEFIDSVYKNSEKLVELDDNYSKKIKGVDMEDNTSNYSNVAVYNK